jgi:hypothetical protein
MLQPTKKPQALALSIPTSSKRWVVDAPAYKEAASARSFHTHLVNEVGMPKTLNAPATNGQWCVGSASGAKI